MKLYCYVIFVILLKLLYNGYIHAVLKVKIFTLANSLKIRIFTYEITLFKKFNVS